MAAIGYIRQSKRADLDLALSPQQQRQDIETLAARDGVAVTNVFEDLGRSGGAGKERHRAGYGDMIAALEAGGVTTVYTKTLTRLGRSVTELYKVLRIAESVGCRIVTMKEGPMDPGTPIGKAQFGMLAVFAEFERDLAVERAKDNVASRRARGERMGRVPYGERPGDQPDRILAAWEASSGSLDDTARRLNKEGVPTWQGQRVKPDGTVEKVQWTGPAVRLVLSRLLPGIIPARAKRGVKPTAGFLLYRLLQCPCGRILTASKDGRGNHDVVYRCHSAGTVAEHRRPPHPDGTPGELVPLYRTREALVLPAIKAEAAHLRRDWDAVLLSEGAERERADLAAQRVQVMDMFQFKGVDRADIQRRLDAIDAAEAALTERTTVIDIPDLDWAQPPATVNAILGAMWERVELGPDLLPVRFVWRRAEWRA